VYNLDNRPKKVGLTSVDFTDPEKDESLRQYLLVSFIDLLFFKLLLTGIQGIGEFTDLEITPERAALTSKDRFIAEKFMYGLPGGELPSVGKVELSWIQTPTSTRQFGCLEGF
jgi:RNA-binding protein 26